MGYIKLTDVGTTLTYVLSIHTFGIMLSLRVWHLYYDYKLTLDSVNENWRTKLNPESDSWFLKNQNTYGNPCYTLKRGFLIEFIYACLYVFSHFFFCVLVFIPPFCLFV